MSSDRASNAVTNVAQLGGRLPESVTTGSSSVIGAPVCQFFHFLQMLLY